MHFVYAHTRTIHNVSIFVHIHIYTYVFLHMIPMTYTYKIVDVHLELLVFFSAACLSKSCQRPVLRHEVQEGPKRISASIVKGALRVGSFSRSF